MHRTGPRAIPNPTIMKTILLLITIVFSSMAVSSCTNDESDTEFDYINPDEEQQATQVVDTVQEQPN